MLTRRLTSTFVSLTRNFTLSSSRCLDLPSSKPLGEDRDKEFQESKKDLTWRTKHKDTFYTKFKLFMDEEERADGKVQESVLGRTSKPLNVSWKAVKDHYNHVTEQAERFNQVFKLERHEILGNDLGASHFIVFRGGRVKFVNGPWVEARDDFSMTSHVPNKFDPSFEVEAMDCEGVNLYYEGLENLRRLKSLLCISFRNIKRFDDWCLDRVSGLQYDKIQVLDIAGTSVTHRGLSAMYRMPTLRKLIVDEPQRDPEWKLSVAMLAEIMPELEVVDSKEMKKIPGFPLESLVKKK